MPIDDWRSRNRDAVGRRLAGLKAKPPGIVYQKRSGLHRIILEKEESGVMRMYFVDPNSATSEMAVSGAMSAIDLADPFDFSPTPYNQAMMLSLIWQQDPRRVYMAGFAGGRIPLALYHHYPSTVIESTDIDAEVREIAERFFGIAYDERQRLFIEDARDYLAKLDAERTYDIILVDVYRGMGFSPPLLATAEFFGVCKEHLVKDGVVAANLVESDPLFSRKVATMVSCFKSTYLQVDRTVTIFGTDGPVLSQEEIVKRAEELEARHHFPYAFVRRALSLTDVNREQRLGPSIVASAILTDATVPTADLVIPRTDPLFYNIGRNELCPCGSGRKFKVCHGR